MNTKSSSLLTYVLFGLLGLFILTAGYYACQRQKERKEQAAREQEEMNKALDDLGYAGDESGAGSSHVAVEDSTVVKPLSTDPKTTAKDPGNKPTAAPAPTTNAPNQPKVPENKTTIAPTTNTTTTNTPTTTKPQPTKPKSAVKGPGTGRWVVRAGTFSYMDGARRRLEEVIRAGYPNAEIVKTSTGKAAVVVFRSNDKNAAIRVADQLEMKGIDAAVFDK